MICFHAGSGSTSPRGRKTPWWRTASRYAPRRVAGRPASPPRPGAASGAGPKSRSRGTTRTSSLSISAQVPARQAEAAEGERSGQEHDRVADDPGARLEPVGHAPDEPLGEGGQGAGQEPPRQGPHLPPPP